METLQVDNGLSVWHALSGSKVSNTPFEARLVASENETSHAVDCILDFRETGLLPMLELQKKQIAVVKQARIDLKGEERSMDSNITLSYS